MQRNGIVVLVSVALLSVAGIVAAYLFTHKPQPEPLSAGEKAIQQAHEERVACLEGGGSWDPNAPLRGEPSCQHSEPTTAAPAVEEPSTSDGGGSGGSGGRTIGEALNGTWGTAEQVVNHFTAAERQAFCSLVYQLGYAPALRVFERKWNAPHPPAQEVFDEAVSRCL
jgi:hypothetical protein